MKSKDIREKLLEALGEKKYRQLQATAAKATVFGLPVVEMDLDLVMVCWAFSLEREGLVKQSEEDALGFQLELDRMVTATKMISENNIRPVPQAESLTKLEFTALEISKKLLELELTDAQPGYIAEKARTLAKALLEEDDGPEDDSEL